MPAKGRRARSGVLLCAERTSTDALAPWAKANDAMNSMQLPSWTCKTAQLRTRVRGIKFELEVVARPSANPGRGSHSPKLTIAMGAGIPIPRSPSSICRLACQWTMKQIEPVRGICFSEELVYAYALGGECCREWCARSGEEPEMPLLNC